MQNALKKYILVSILAVAGIFSSAPALAAGSPTMITNPATSVTTTSARLNGHFSSSVPGTTDVRFEYGITSMLGSYTSYTSYATGSGIYSDTITGLAPNTTYYFRAMGVDSSLSGPQFGLIASFTTPGVALPTADTYPATITGASTVKLNGFFNSNGSPTSTWFEYATNSSFTASSTTTYTPQAGASGSFSDTLTGIPQNVKYYFRAVAQNAGGTTYATPTLSFIIAPVVVTPPCTINSFNTTANTIPLGGTITLSWDSTPGCVSASLVPNGGTSISSATSSTGITLSPTVNTTYRLTVSGSSATNTDTKDVIVTISGATSPQCKITSFISNQYNVTPGTPAVLSWSTSNCVSAYLNGSSVSLSSSGYSVIPNSPSSTYTLTAYGTNLSNTDSVSVTVSTTNINTSSCRINLFFADQSVITVGTPVTFSWMTSNCSTTTINGNAYTSPVRLYPNTNTRYTLYASNGTSDDSRVVFVSVISNGTTTGGYYGSTTTGGTSGSTGNSGYRRTGDTTGGSTTSYGTSGSGGQQSVGSPLATTYSYQNISGTVVLIYGSVNSNGDSGMRAWFEYGTSPSLGATTQVQTFGLNANPSAQIYNLVPYTTYYYRVAAQNGYGTSYGSIYSFVSGGPLVKQTTPATSTKNTSTVKSSADTTGEVDPNLTVNDYKNSLPASASKSSSGINFLWILVFIIVVLIIIIITRTLTRKSMEKEGGHHTPSH
jgi:hypothetical protein